MKSLSDYTKILRDTATNLNLHGESVEMIVQMLANALYISEVEHVAYSQEASLERASLENSKIQHCVNQMYSVYRGANPRVIMNIRATKLFEFNPHQEIIRSNNYKVYYLGYYNEDTKVLEYSPKTVYPDTVVTIIGLCASDLYTESWTVGSRNPYYRTIPETDLSSDLYLSVNGVLTDTTRIFSDHLRYDLPFDLTIPGYGMRLYYPESLQGDAGINTTYSLSVYKYLELSSILDSEKKALKMQGSVITSFSDPNYDREEVLYNLSAEETYPGLIFIPETSKDRINTLHHQANKERFTGTFMATNSDLSWLLYEYYPSKIRRGGVTHVFGGINSTEIKEIQGERDLTSDLNSKNNKTFLELWTSLKNDWTEGELGYLPEGALTLRYKKTPKTTEGGSNSSYDILPGYSVIPVYTAPGESSLVNDYIQAGISSMTIQILKNVDGITEILSTGADLVREGLTLYTCFPTQGVSKNKYTSTSNTPIQIYIPDISSQVYEDLELSLYRGNSLLDTEYVPFVYSPVQAEVLDKYDEPQVIGGTGEFYTLDLDNDTLYLQTDLDGAVLSTSTTTATLYYNGESVTGNGCVYSIIPVSDLNATIDSTSGVIEIKEMSEEKLSCVLPVLARYRGKNTIKNLVVKKSISNLSSSLGESSKFTITSKEHIDPIIDQTAYSGLREVKIDIPPRTYKSLEINKTGDITFSDCSFEYRYTKSINVLKEGETSTPTLYLYYIPYSGFNILDKSEKEEFIKNHKAYYVSHKIEINPGTPIIARFDISLDLYKNTTLDSYILEILQKYEYEFGVDLEEGSETFNEIKSLITKISEVKNVNSMKVTYIDPSTGNPKDLKEIGTPVYYKVEYNISSIVRS